MQPLYGSCLNSVVKVCGGRFIIPIHPVVRVHHPQGKECVEELCENLPIPTRMQHFTQM